MIPLNCYAVRTFFNFFELLTHECAHIVENRQGKKSTDDTHDTDFFILQQRLADKLIENEEQVFEAFSETRTTFPKQRRVVIKLSEFLVRQFLPWFRRFTESLPV